MQDPITHTRAILRRATFFGGRLADTSHLCQMPDGQLTRPSDSHSFVSYYPASHFYIEAADSVRLSTFVLVFAWPSLDAHRLAYMV